MRAYYINLDKRADRRAFMEAQFAALGLEVERVVATTPESIGNDDVAPLTVDAAMERLSPPEVATLISHFRIWKHMVEQDLPWVLVLEDDVLLSHRLPQFLASVDGAGADPGILRIETRLTEVQIHPKAEPGPPGFDFHIPLSFEAGSAAYIISAASAARILSSPLRFSLPIDDILFSLVSPFRNLAALRVAVPALAVNRMECSPVFDVPESILISDSQPGRDMRNARQAPKMPAGLKKIRREIGRIGRQVRGAYPAISTRLFARTTIVPFADGEIT